MVLSPDSGPAHIATTQGTPVIGLYAYHNPLRTAPYNNLDNVISVYEE
ncbi:lipopolysaccharide biosynthesis protein, partial [Haemophilus influenzae HK1212]